MGIYGRQWSRPRGSRQGIKPPGQRRVLGDHGLDLFSVTAVEVVAQGAPFLLFGLDLGQALGIGVCGFQRFSGRFGPVGDQAAQYVLGDFEADASGEDVWHLDYVLLIRDLEVLRAALATLEAASQVRIEAKFLGPS